MRTEFTLNIAATADNFGGEWDCADEYNQKLAEAIEAQFPNIVHLATDGQGMMFSDDWENPTEGIHEFVEEIADELAESVVGNFEGLDDIHFEGKNNLEFETGEFGQVRIWNKWLNSEDPEMQALIGELEDLDPHNQYFHEIDGRAVIVLDQSQIVSHLAKLLINTVAEYDG